MVKLEKFATNNPDIIVIGLQEIVKLNMLSILKGKDKNRVNEWQQILSNVVEHIQKDEKDVSERYIFVTAKSMVGLFIAVFVKAKMLGRIRDLKSTKIKTGAGGSAGNKGAVIVRFKLDDTNILFMNCHLMSGKNKGSKRTEELNLIFENAFKYENYKRKYCVEKHPVAFIFGDLNYRISLQNEIVRPAIENGNYDQLKEYDELITLGRQFGNSDEIQHVFYREFKEGEIGFPPTYKYDRNTNKYDSSKK